MTKRAGEFWVFFCIKNKKIKFVKSDLKIDWHTKTFEGTFLEKIKRGLQQSPLPYPWKKLSTGAFPSKTKPY
ncbi:MAG: hypothetical protein AAB381_03115 [Patescibacteria group bacterium]